MFPPYIFKKLLVLNMDLCSITERLGFIKLTAFAAGF